MPECISLCTLYINKISQTGLWGIRVVSGGDEQEISDGKSWRQRVQNQQTNELFTLGNLFKQYISPK